MRFSGEHGAKFSDQLFSTLLEQVQKGYKNVKIRNELSTVDSFDGTQSQIRAMGRKLGADLVVWGTVNCTTKQACISARITVVSKDLGWPVGWMRLEPENRVASDELGESAMDMDKRVLGLASRAIGLALYTAKNYVEAAWHLQKACEGNEADAMQARVPLMDCCMPVSYTHLTDPDSRYCCHGFEADSAASRRQGVVRAYPGYIAACDWTG